MPNVDYDGIRPGDLPICAGCGREVFRRALGEAEWSCGWHPNDDIYVIRGGIVHTYGREDVPPASPMNERAQQFLDKMHAKYPNE